MRERLATLKDDPAHAAELVAVLENMAATINEGLAEAERIEREECERAELPADDEHDR